MNFERKKGFRFLGLDKQKIIKYFFGGNASLAIFILVLICVFLAKDAVKFFPAHHDQLKTYRKAGLEYFTWIEDSYQKYKVDAGGLSRAYQAELNHKNLANASLVSTYESTRLTAERKIGKKLIVLKDAISQRKDLYPADSPKAARYDALIEKLKSDINAMKPEVRSYLTPKWHNFNAPRFEDLKLKEFAKAHGKEAAAEEREKIIDAVLDLDLWERGEAEYYDLAEEKSDEVIDVEWEKTKYINDFFLDFKNNFPEPLEEVWGEASAHTKTTRNRAESNEKIADAIRAQVKVAFANDDNVKVKKYGSALEVMTRAEFFEIYAKAFYADRFSRALKNLKPDDAAYASQPSGVREKAEAILEEVKTLNPAFYAALSGEGSFTEALSSVDETALSKERAAILIEMSGLDPSETEVLQAMADNGEAFIDPFPFDAEAETVYALTPRYRAAISEMKEKGMAALAQLPADDKLTTDLAKTEINAFRKNFTANIKELDDLGTDLENWRHDKPWSWGETFGAFFFGKKWTNNSQIQDRYGILPMFTGSLIISVIALIVSVPIAVAGAIYVNQIAPFREQSFLKPAIEFIGAIPSVVLGFLGIVVVGEMLKVMSEWGWLSWIPGFPIEARLNILVAGLLLAFMAIPIIFTLAEDALNNVPKAYRDGSLSLGANRLQTAFRVVVPASLSGVIAAILLGFGRVIGETMVVLLVAGNRIAIPDFSKGIGVVTEPTHTMTGIIAQGLGEAAKDSVDYYALFMVGLVLFTITLIINFIGQTILNKYQAK